MSDITGTIFNLQRYSIDDGPGIRTTVFTKGCPLRCPWCSNPESQNPKPELLYRYTACQHCGACAAACPENAIEFDADKNIHINREKCTVCGACAEACPADAMTITGEVMTVSDVMKTILRDEVYYDDGGGVTCSGGEILTQPDFVTEIFKQCHERGIHTNADTSGFGTEEAMKKVLEYSDLVFFDLKIMDPEKHLEIIGVPLDVVLNNLKLAADAGKPIVIRFPMVPGYNDSDENLKAMGEFIKGLNAKEIKVDILPYHKYGENKYAGVGMVYPIDDVPVNTQENLDRAKSVLESYGLKVEISQ